MIKLAIFDMDGTIFESHLNWQEIKRHLNVQTNILKEINYGDPDNLNREKLALLEKYERENTLRAKPVKGIHSFMKALKIKRIPAALLTNNNLDNTRYLLKKHKLEDCFDHLLTRESGMFKPDGLPFNYLFSRYHCTPVETISIGDSHYDIRASREAGIGLIYIIHSEKADKLKRQYPMITLFKDYQDLRILVSPILEKLGTDVDASTTDKN